MKVVICGIHKLWFICNIPRARCHHRNATITKIYISYELRMIGDTIVVYYVILSENMCLFDCIDSTCIMLGVFVVNYIAINKN